MKCYRKPSIFDMIVGSFLCTIKNIECAKLQYECAKQQYKEAEKNYQLRVTRIL